MAGCRMACKFFARYPNEKFRVAEFRVERCCHDGALREQVLLRLREALPSLGFEVKMAITSIAYAADGFVDRLST
jgi:hypothetical protein